MGGVPTTSLNGLFFPPCTQDSYPTHTLEHIAHRFPLFSHVLCFRKAIFFIFFFPPPLFIIPFPLFIFQCIYDFSFFLYLMLSSVCSHALFEHHHNMFLKSFFFCFKHKRLFFFTFFHFSYHFNTILSKSTFFYSHTKPFFLLFCFEETNTNSLLLFSSSFFNRSD